MLNPATAAAQVATSGEPWKNHVYRPVDESRIQVWKRELDGDQNRVSEALVGDRLTAYGYESLTPWAKTALIHPSLGIMLRYRESLEILSRANIQLRCDGENSDLIVFAGNPDRDGWISHQKPERWLDLLDILVEIVRRKLSRQSVIWISDDVDRIGSGWSSRLIALALDLAGHERLPGENQLYFTTVVQDRSKPS